MWGNLLYFLPIASFLSAFRLKEDITLDGDLEEEFTKLIKTYVDAPNFKLDFHMKNKARINSSFPAETSLWTVFDCVMNKFHLVPQISTEDGEKVCVTLEEGSAWTRWTIQ